jgi:hypothetical protein
MQAEPAEPLNTKRMNFALNITTCEAPPNVAATAAAAGYKDFRLLY